MSFFTVWDYLVLALVLVISAAIGVYYRLTGGRQKTTKEYLLAGGNMPAWPVSFSLMASFMSAITLLGVSQESYQYGTTFAWINLAYVFSTPIVAYLFLPVFYNMRATSVYEYLEKRFGYSTRLAASTAFSLQMILYMGIVLYAPALALEAVTGISKGTAILVMGCVCTFYSVMGGMKAVMVTDVFQSVLMFAAIYCVILCSAFKGDGFGAIWETAAANGRINFTVFSPDPTIRHSVWSLLIGGSATYLSIYGINQAQIQRLMSVKSLKSAQRALWFNLPILCSISFSTLFSGLALYYYYKNCDPVLEGRINVRDQLMPLFVVDTMGAYPGLSGLFVSGIFSASLSTVSSAVNSLSAVTLEDYIKPFYEKILHKPLETNTALPTKIMACLYGVICVALAFCAGALGGVLQASLTIFGIVGGPLLGLFTLGMFTTKANQRGSLLGLLVSFVFSFWIGFGRPKPPIPVLPLTSTGCSNFNETIAAVTTTLAPPTETEYFYLFKLSYLWLSVLGFLITVILGYILSVSLEKLKLANNDVIYVDDARTEIDYDLFVPPLSNRLKRKSLAQMVILNGNGHCHKNTEF